MLLEEDSCAGPTLIRIYTEHPGGAIDVLHLITEQLAEAVRSEGPLRERPGSATPPNLALVPDGRP